jgi:hypothetical protein
VPRITIDLSSKDHERFTIAKMRRGGSLQSLMIGATSRMLDGADGAAPTDEPAAPPRAVATPSYAPQNRRWHDMLETILNSGDDRAIEAVQPNLVLFDAWVTQRAPAQKPIRKAKREIG